MLSTVWTALVNWEGMIGTKTVFCLESVKVVEFPSVVGGISLEMLFKIARELWMLHCENC